VRAEGGGGGGAAALIYPQRSFPRLPSLNEGLSRRERRPQSTCVSTSRAQPTLPRVGLRKHGVSSRGELQGGRGPPKTEPPQCLSLFERTRGDLHSIVCLQTLLKNTTWVNTSIPGFEKGNHTGSPNRGDWRPESLVIPSRISLYLSTRRGARKGSTKTQGENRFIYLVSGLDNAL